MLRRSLLLGAALGVALMATAPAEASWRVIKWNTTGMCQIWDFGVDGAPFPYDFHMMSRPLPSFAAALSVKNRLWNAGRCTL